MRARNKFRKQQSRDKLNTPRKEEERFKDRKRKSRSTCLFPDVNLLEPWSPKSPSYSKLLKKSKLVRDILGDDPNFHTDILCHVIRKCMRSPRKQLLMQEKLPCLNSDNKNAVDSKLRKIAVLKTKRKFSDAKQVAGDLLTEYGSCSQIVARSSEYRSNVYRLLSCSSGRNKDQDSYIRKLSDETKNEIVSTFLDAEVSYDLPDTKYVGLKFMSCTMEEAYQMYLQRCSSSRVVAKSTFMKLKPDNIRTIQDTPLRGCKCEVCCNFGFLRDTLVGKGFKGIPKGHTAAIEASWCPFRNDRKPFTIDPKVGFSFEEFPKKECVVRKCSECGILRYSNSLKELNHSLLESNDTVTYKQWEYQEASQNKKSKATNRKMGMVYYSKPIQEVLAHYLKHLHEMSLHQFNKLWQQKQFKITKSNLHHGQVLFVLDFAQNLLLYSQSEPQACHWDHQQVTVHPIVAYYPCPDAGCDELVVEDVIHITADRSHDLQAVCLFERKTIEYLKKQNIHIDELIEYTDNAGQQYKNKDFFLYLSMMKIRATRHFFGVRHGKGPSDRAAANFKNFVKNVIKTGKVNFRTVQELVDYCAEHYEKNEKHRKVKVIFHNKVPRRPQKKLKPLPGTRSIYSVRNIGVSGVAEKRNMSCSCKKCQNGLGICAFPEYADEWVRFSVVIGGHRKKELPKLKSHFDYLSLENRDDIHNDVMNNCDEITPGTNMSGCSSTTNDLALNISTSEFVEPEAAIVVPSRNADSDKYHSDVTNNEPFSDLNHSFDWATLQSQVEGAQDYEELSTVVRERASDIPPVVTRMKMVVSASDPIDTVATKFYPSDGPRGKLCVRNGADGNCLPRSFSHLFFGTECRYQEVRLRMIFEAVQNEEIYLSDDYLGRGLRGKSSRNVAVSYCMYSGVGSVTSRRLNARDIRNVYRADVMSTRTDGTEMGMWQFHHATQVFKRPIGSVYPEGTNPFVRAHTNRVVLPFNECYDQREPVHVMWTPLRMNRKAYDVRHFVPLMWYEFFSCVVISLVSCII